MRFSPSLEKQPRHVWELISLRRGPLIFAYHRRECRIFMRQACCSFWLFHPSLAIIPLVFHFQAVRRGEFSIHANTAAWKEFATRWFSGFGYFLHPLYSYSLHFLVSGRISLVPIWNASSIMIQREVICILSSLSERVGSLDGSFYRVSTAFPRAVFHYG